MSNYKNQVSLLLQVLPEVAKNLVLHYMEEQPLTYSLEICQDCLWILI